MPTVSKTFAFLSNAENFVASPGSASHSLTWVSNLGNPAGSLQARVQGRNVSNTRSEWRWDGTWEQLGVPAGATVTSIQLLDCSTACTAYNVGRAGTIGPYELQDSGGVLIGTLWTGRSFSATTAWINALAQPAVAVPNHPSSTAVRIVLADTIGTGNNTAANVQTNDDQVQLLITYSDPVPAVTHEIAASGASTSTGSADALQTGTVAHSVTASGASLSSGAGDVLVVPAAPAGGGIADIKIDPSTPAHVSGTGNLVTASFTAPAGALLVAFYAAETSSSAGNYNNITSLTDTGGLTWTRHVYKSLDPASTGGAGVRGNAEVWSAKTTTAEARTVTAVHSDGRVSHMSVQVFTGADKIGAVAAAGGTGLPSVSLTTTASKSWVWAARSDNQVCTAATVGAGQTKVNETNSTAKVSATVWRQNLVTDSAGTAVTLNITAPTGQTWDAVAVEILPQITGPITHSAAASGGSSSSGSADVTIAEPTNRASASGLSVSSGSLAATVYTPPPSLPGLIDGITIESHTHMPPVIDSNGNLYNVTESYLADGNQPMMMKSSNGGMTWVEVDRANRPQWRDQETGWQEQVGNQIWYSMLGADFGIATFNTSDHPTAPDTWQLKEAIPITLGASIGSAQYMSMARRSTGEWVFGCVDGIVGTDFRVCVFRRTGANTYSAKTTLETSGSFTNPVVVAGANDTVHIFYKDHTNGRVYWRTLSAANVLSSAVRIDTGGTLPPFNGPEHWRTAVALTNAVYYDDSGVEVVSIGFASPTQIMKVVTIRNGVVGPEETVSNAAVLQDPGITDSFSFVAHLAVDPQSKALHAIWARASDGNVMHNVKALGGAWAGSALLKDTPGTDVNAQWIYNNVYTNKSGSKVMGYTYDLSPHPDDDSNIWYDELLLPTGTAHVISASGSSASSGSLSVTSRLSAASSGASSSTGSGAVRRIHVSSAAGSSASAGSAGLRLTLVASGSASSASSASLAASAVRSVSASGTGSSTGSAGLTALSRIGGTGASTTSGSAITVQVSGYSLSATGLSVSSGGAATGANFSPALSGGSSASGSLSVSKTTQLSASGASSSSGSAAAGVRISPSGAGSSVSAGSASVTAVVRIGASGASAASGSLLATRGDTVILTGSTKSTGGVVETMRQTAGASAASLTVGSLNARSVLTLAAVGASMSNGAVIESARLPLSAFGESRSDGDFRLDRAGLGADTTVAVGPSRVGSVSVAAAAARSSVAASRTSSVTIDPVKKDWTVGPIITERSR